MNEEEKWASDIATENRELRALLRAIRNFCGAFEWWDELYGEDAMRLIGGEDNEHN